MARRRGLSRSGRGPEQGQATILVVAILTLAAVVLSAGIAFAGALADVQRADGIARIAAAAYQPGADQPLARARSIAKANDATDVRMTGPTTIEVEVPVRSPAWRLVGRSAITAESELAQVPLAGGPGIPADIPGSGSATWPVSGHLYTGPLTSVDSARLCPAVASSFVAMKRQAAAAGIALYATSGWRGYAEQAALFANLGPGIAAPPGTSLHHAATEVDIAVGPAGSPAHRWLQTNASHHGFIQRYSWEPWHWGHVRGC